MESVDTPLPPPLYHPCSGPWHIVAGWEGHVHSVALPCRVFLCLQQAVGEQGSGQGPGQRAGAWAAGRGLGRERAAAKAPVAISLGHAGQGAWQCAMEGG